MYCFHDIIGEKDRRNNLLLDGDVVIMGEYVKKKKDMVFQNVESLQQVVNVLNEAVAAINDKSRTIREVQSPKFLPVP